MQKKNSGKKPIEKIVVMGCSYTKPGQSGVEKVWSQYLQDFLGIEVLNLTTRSGGSNSEILRKLSQYIWTHDVQNTGFITQWTTIDRLEFCWEEKEWFNIRQNYTRPNTLSENKIPIDIRLQMEKIRECQAYTYSESTHLWYFFQQIMALDSIMKQNHCPYFQIYCMGKVMNDFFLDQMKPIYFSQYSKPIYKMLKRTKWLYNNIIRADISNKGYPVVSQDDPHFNKTGHALVAKTFEDYIRKEHWI